MADQRNRHQRAMDDAAKAFGVPYQAFEDFNLQEGDRIGYDNGDGVIYTGIITSIDQNKATGEVKIECAAHLDGSPGWDAITQPVGTILDGLLP